MGRERGTAAPRGIGPACTPAVPAVHARGRGGSLTRRRLCHPGRAGARGRLHLGGRCSCSTPPPSRPRTAWRRSGRPSTRRRSPAASSTSDPTSACTRACTCGTSAPRTSSPPTPPGFRLVRTPRHLRMESPPVVALAVQAGGVGRFGQFGVQAVVPARAADAQRPDGALRVLVGGRRRLPGVPGPLRPPRPAAGRGARAAPRLRRSPLHGLVRDHLVRLSAAAERLSADPGAASLGPATVELVRALLVSAAGDDRYARAVREETLLTRVLAYARAHLTEADLGPRRLAAAHNISLRQLYKVFAEAGLHLEQWLIAERLELARASWSPGPGGTARSRPWRAAAGSPTRATSPAGSGRPTACRRGSGSRSRPAGCREPRSGQ